MSKMIINGHEIKQHLDTVVADSPNAVQNSAIYSELHNNGNLATSQKDIIQAINGLKAQFDGLGGVVKVKVVLTEPAIETVTPPEIYYVGSTNPRQVLLYTKNAANITIKTDLGTTSIDLTGYLKGTDVKDSLTDTSTDKPLSANQGKVLNEGKVNISDIQDNLTSTDTDKPLSANQGKVLKDLDDAKLPLAGGTMTGEITAKSNTDFGIHVSNNNTYLGLSGSNGSGAYDGCVLFLTGKDHADWHGGFGIRTGNGNSADSKTFSGTPDGVLKWNNKRVETSDIKTTGLTVTGRNGATATISSQKIIEHEQYYEYYFVVTVSGGTRSSAAQTDLAVVSGFQGTGTFTHLACPVWVEGGNNNVSGLVYSNTAGATSVSLYICATTATADLRYNCHIIRMK